MGRPLAAPRPGAAWGNLQKKGSQLHIRSFELGVLAVPSLEAAFRASPYAAFCAHPHQAPARQFTLPRSACQHTLTIAETDAAV